MIDFGWNPGRLLEKIGLMCIYVFHPNILVMKLWDGWLKFGYQTHLVSDNNCDYVHLLNKEWQRMLGSHLVLATLHTWFKIDIEQGKY